MTDPIRSLANARTTVASAARWTLIAFLFGAGAIFGGYAWGQDGPDVLPDAPSLTTPTVTFKMERNAQESRGQEFIRFNAILGIYKTTREDGTTEIRPANGTCYQRVSSIDRVVFDHGSDTSAMETCRVYLTNGSWYVVAGSVTDVWERLAEAGPYEFKPAKGEKE